MRALATALAGVALLCATLPARSGRDDHVETPTPTVRDKAETVVKSFKSGGFIVPPRSIDDVRLRLGQVRAIAKDCIKRRASRAQFMSKATESIARTTDSAVLAANAGTLNSIVVYELSRGNYAKTVEQLELALKRLSDLETDEGRGYRAILSTQLARIRGLLGDESEAAEALAAADALWKFNSLGSIQRQYKLLGKASLALSRGAVGEAEETYRELLENPFPEYSNYAAIDEMDVRSDLARALLLQQRSVEAEVESRKAIQRFIAYPGLIKDIDIRATLAQPVTTLAQALFHQVRLADAEYVARMGVFIHEIDCSWPDSVAYARARLILARVLAAGSAWQQVVELFDSAARDLRDDPVAFDRLYGNVSTFGLALVHSGRATEGLRVFEALARGTRQRFGASSDEHALARGFLGLAHAKSGEFRRAIHEFSDARAVLMSRGLGLDIQDLRHLQTGYIEFISRERDRVIDSAMDPVAELFEVASLLQAGAVQEAVIASGTRAAARDEKMADLVRREQDSGYQINALLSRLSDLEAAPAGQVRTSSIDRLRQQIRDLRELQTELRDEVRQRFPDYANLVNPGAPTIAAIREVLHHDEVLLSVYSGEHETMVWAIPKRGTPAYNVVALSRGSIEGSVRELRRSVDPSAETLGDIPAFPMQTAYRLYLDLLKPVEAGWAGANAMLVVTNGALGQIPLGILITEEVSELNGEGPLFSEYASVPWLAREHAIASLPSWTALITLRNIPTGGSARRAYAGFGDPWFTVGEQETAEAGRAAGSASSSAAQSREVEIHRRSAPATRGLREAGLSALPRLPDTAEEVLEIAATLGADPSTDVFLGKHATERRIKTMTLHDRRVLVFATHGLVPGDLDGLVYPALAFTSPELSGDEGDDGLLTMDEILGLRLDADWVVLSACNTAASGGQGTEAVSGLGRAFFYAGSRALLVSNWPVESTSAKKLTTDVFRRQASDPGLSRAEALSQAMIAVMDGPGFRDGAGRVLFTYAHPIFWAPFSLVGDGS